VVRKTWSWPVGKALPVLLIFLAFDIPFVVANLGKFTDGGYVPIILGMLVLLVMVIWNRGRSLLAHRSRMRFPSLEAAMARVEANVAARVPGTAVFMSSGAGVLPNPLIRHVERSHSLHETVILLTIRVVGQPTVPDADRYRVDKLKWGFYRVVAYFGFMEEPQAVPLLKAVTKDAGIPFPVDNVTYYLGRENFLASARGHMGIVTESIFAFLQQNSLAADRFFGLPPKQVVELGTQLDL
jgi:KUP system potassium uptake protein